MDLAMNATPLEELAINDFTVCLHECKKKDVCLLINCSEIILLLQEDKQYLEDSEAQTHCRGDFSVSENQQKVYPRRIGRCPAPPNPCHFHHELHRCALSTLQQMSNSILSAHE